MNQYELLFDEFLDTIGLSLIRYTDGSWSTIDRDMGDIISDKASRFNNATDLFSFLSAYIRDYIIYDICVALKKANIDYSDCLKWEDYLKYRDELPDEKYNFLWLDMICVHSEEIDLNNCSFEYACDSDPVQCAYNILVLIRDGKYDESYLDDAIGYLGQYLGEIDGCGRKHKMFYKVTVKSEHEYPTLIVEADSIEEVKAATDYEVDVTPADYIYVVTAIPYFNNKNANYPAKEYGTFATEEDAMSCFAELTEKAEEDTAIFFDDDEKINQWLLQCECFEVREDEAIYPYEIIDQYYINSIWFAILKDKEDTDWGTGSFDFATALDMARRYNYKYIADIENGQGIAEINEVSNFD